MYFDTIIKTRKEEGSLLNFSLKVINPVKHDES